MTDDDKIKAHEDGPPSITQQEKAAAAEAGLDHVRSTASPKARPRYTPQFSATTEMILKRIRGEPSNMSSAISSAPASGTINKTSYEDAKRRLVMSMNTSISLPMPAVPALPPRPAPSMVLPKKETLQPPAALIGPPLPRPRGRPPKADKDKKGKAPRVVKRKRGKDEDEGSSPLSEPPDSDEGAVDHQEATPTMTKSGRQVSKPSQFNPATAAAGAKRKHYGKRTAEQALCKVCTRGLSPQNNQVVFCDGCNLCWHQMCHDPYIDDDFVSDETRSWFCRGCLSKREKHLAKKKSVDGHKGVSWASKSKEQKRTYLSGLPQAQLVNLVMYSLELHPDLALFPEGTGVKRGRPSAASLALASNGGGGGSLGPIHFVKSAGTPESRPANGNGASDSSQLERTERERSEDIPAAWPRVGSGVLANMSMNEADFEDRNDFESFSVADFDPNTGKKMVENGMPISSQEQYV